MVLNFGNQQSRDFGQFEKRLFTGTRKSEGIVTVTEGVATTVTFEFGTQKLSSEKDVYGTLLNFSLGNFTGASRETTVTISNLTQGTELFTQTIDLNNELFNGTFFFSLEEIAPGDAITTAFTGEGVGTAFGGPISGYFKTDLNTIFREDDESK